MVWLSRVLGGFLMQGLVSHCAGSRFGGGTTP